MKQRQAQPPAIFTIAHGGQTVRCADAEEASHRHKMRAMMIDEFSLFGRRMKSSLMRTQHNVSSLLAEREAPTHKSNRLQNSNHEGKGTYLACRYWTRRLW
jgi:hypothetical protein